MKDILLEREDDSLSSYDKEWKIKDNNLIGAKITSVKFTPFDEDIVISLIKDNKKIELTCRQGCCNGFDGERDLELSYKVL